MAKGAGIADLSHLGRREAGGAREDALERIAAGIDAIKNAHVFPPLMKHFPVILAAAGNEEQLDSQSAVVSWLICQSFVGTVDVYWASSGGGTLPPMRFGVTAFPILIPVSPKGYTFTVRANGGPANFSITLVS